MMVKKSMALNVGNRASIVNRRALHPVTPRSGFITGLIRIVTLIDLAPQRCVLRDSKKRFGSSR
jgi:hypothetical protein